MNPHPIDDDDVARLVREVAEGWVMPPVRLDQPSWRDRIRGPRERRSAALEGWFGRLGQAATAAIVLTVAAALVAVYLTGPRAGVGESPNPASGRAPTPTAGAAASPLPKLFLNGDLPSPATVLVQLAQMNFAYVDLASGSLGSPLTSSSWGSQVHPAPSGGLVCLCIGADGYAQGNFTHMTVSLERFDAAGTVVSRTVVVDVTGQPDPRGATADQTGHVSAAATFSADGRYAYLGWSARAHPSWTSGVTIVELDTGSITQRVTLPEKSDGSGDSRTYVDAPRVVGTAGGRVVIDRNGYTYAAASAASSYHTSSDLFLATVSGGTLGDPVALALGTGCGNDVTLAGGLADGGLWLSCATYETGVLNVIRRLKPDLSLAGDTSVGAATVEGSTSVLSADGASLFAWNPISLTLTRVNLATGESATGQAPKPGAAIDPLTALGHWLAPSAAAKSVLQAGISISPDGSRIYALGIDGNPQGPGFVGSAGVLVFDARTLAPLGRWAPTADFDSIAVSADGSLVYAAGAPDVGADGAQTNQQASITVFDSTSGTVRLIAGQLGHGTVTFTGTTLK
ncbi:MAG TPA: hypothetical protein VKC59_02630 [Candidatus Limnocylindrales bacterium]|nr:hypothetical protein [Candidatus Limnocylindrales bacterium]